MRTPAAANLCKCQNAEQPNQVVASISLLPSLTDKLFTFNSLQEALIPNRDESALRFERQHICTKQFPQAFHSGEQLQNLCKVFKKNPFSGGIVNFWSTGTGVTLTQIPRRRSDCSRASQHSPRQEKEDSQERKDTTYGDSHDAKRQQNQPNDGIDHQSEQRERPTEEKQDAPQKESDHGNLLISYYARTRFEVPSFANALSLSLRAIDTGTSASSNICESSTAECRTRPSA